MHHSRMLIANGVIKQAARDYSRSVRYAARIGCTFSQKENWNNVWSRYEISSWSRHFRVVQQFCNNYSTATAGQRYQWMALIVAWISSIKCIYFIANIEYSKDKNNLIDRGEESWRMIFNFLASFSSFQFQRGFLKDLEKENRETSFPLP